MITFCILAFICSVRHDLSNGFSYFFPAKNAGINSELLTHLSKPLKRLIIELQIEVLLNPIWLCVLLIKACGHKQGQNESHFRCANKISL